MAKVLKEKKTKFLGPNSIGEGTISSFTGRKNEGRGCCYIAMEINDWLTLAQAERLVEILNKHIERIEAHNGVSFTKGSSTLTKGTAQAANKNVEGYSESEAHRFVSAVMDLAQKEFQHCEVFHKCGTASGEKSQIDIRFEAWKSHQNRPE